MANSKPPKTPAMPTQKHKRADEDISPAKEEVKRARHHTTQKRKHDNQTDEQEIHPTEKAVAEHTTEAADRLHANYSEPTGLRKSRRIAGLLATSTEDTQPGSGRIPSSAAQNAPVDVAQNVEGNVSTNANVNEVQNAAADQASAISLPTTGATPRGSETPDGNPQELTAHVIAARKARIHRFLDVLSDNTAKNEFSDQICKKASGWYALIESLNADTNLDEMTKRDEIRNAQQSAQEFDDSSECFEHILLSSIGRTYDFQDVPRDADELRFLGEKFWNCYDRCEAKHTQLAEQRLVTADLTKEQSALNQDMSQYMQRHDPSVNTTLPNGTQTRKNRIGSGTFSQWGARLLGLSRRHEESLQAASKIRNTLREEEGKLNEIVVRALLKIGRLPFEAGGGENRQSQVSEMIDASAVPNTAPEKRLDGNKINKSSTGGSSLGHRPSG